MKTEQQETNNSYCLEDDSLIISHRETYEQNEVLVSNSKSKRLILSVSVR